MYKARGKSLQKLFGSLLLFVLITTAGLSVQVTNADDYSWTGNADQDGLYAANDCNDYDPDNLEECTIGIIPAVPMWYEYGGTPTCTEGITVRRCFPNGWCEDVTYLRNCN